MLSEELSFIYVLPPPSRYKCFVAPKYIWLLGIKVVLVTLPAKVAALSEVAIFKAALLVP